MVNFPTVGAIIIALIVLIILWFITSIPVYIAGKMVAGRNATVGRAMGANAGRANRLHDRSRSR